MDCVEVCPVGNEPMVDILRARQDLVMMESKFPEEAIPGLGYGLTETNAIGAIISGKFYEAKPHSTGRPTPPVSAIKIFDDKYNLGVMYEFGEGVEKSYKKAYEYYLFAARRDNLESQIRVAEMYRVGIGTEKNLDKSDYCLTRIENSK